MELYACNPSTPNVEMRRIQFPCQSGLQVRQCLKVSEMIIILAKNLFKSNYTILHIHFFKGGYETPNSNLIVLREKLRVKPRVLPVWD